mmetsp:Transcript_43859/g.100433  ORF Transcript_43859/g.100433 Transcript_43859/m.100433 type:complete len:190 (-) Transcript_43859:143-712(-)
MSSQRRANAAPQRARPTSHPPTCATTSASNFLRSAILPRNLSASFESRAHHRLVNSLSPVSPFCMALPTVLTCCVNEKPVPARVGYVRLPQVHSWHTTKALTMADSPRDEPVFRVLIHCSDDKQIGSRRATFLAEAKKKQKMDAMLYLGPGDVNEALQLGLGKEDAKRYLDVILASSGRDHGACSSLDP